MDWLEGLHGEMELDALVRLINAFAMIGLPIFLGVLFVKRLKVEWRLYMVGVGTFVASQILHIPFNAFVLARLLTRLDISVERTGLPLLATSLAFGLSAGVFEEGARFLSYRVWLRKERSWREALMFGLGHGGIEAILLGGIAAYALIQALTFRGADLSAVVPVERLAEASAQLESYWNLPWYGALLGAVERGFAITIQISLAVLMLQAFVRKQARWGVAALLWHTLIDAVAVLAFHSVGAYITEGLIAVTAIISLVIIFKLRDFPTEDQPPTTDQAIKPPRTARPFPVTDSDHVTKEHIEGSRYLSSFIKVTDRQGISAFPSCVKHRD